MMLSLTRKDVIGSLATGVTAGCIVWQLSDYLFETTVIRGIPLILFPVILPVVWVVGVELGHRLGKRWHFFSQFGRFIAIGLTNATVDFGLFNLLFAVTDRQPNLYLWLNIISFIAAVIHSYLWNKFWTFESNSTHNAGREFGAFVAVNLVALCFNVGTSYLTFRELVTVTHIGVTVAANFGKVAGALVGLIFNFLGFRFVVFKKRHEPFDDPYVV